MIDTSKGVWHLAEENSSLLCRTKCKEVFPDPNTVTYLKSILLCLSTAWQVLVIGGSNIQDGVLDAIVCHRMLVMRGGILPIKRCRGSI